MSSERAIAQSVIAWLQVQHWEIYPEVQPGAGSPRADIVAKQGGRIWVVEVKTSLSLAVIAQAWWWLPYAHWVSVATRSARHGKGRSMAMHVLEWKGIGLIEASDGIVHQDLSPALHRRIDTRYLGECVGPGHQEMGVAGSQHSYWTPYKATCQRVLAYVQKNPGCTMRELVDSIRHHYSSDTTARSCLLGWISVHKVPGVRAERDGRRMRLWPCEQGCKG